jgi:hypothetical protein
MKEYKEQNAGQNNNIKAGNKPIISAEHFKYLARTLTNQN